MVARFIYFIIMLIVIGACFSWITWGWEQVISYLTFGGTSPNTILGFLCFPWVILFGLFGHKTAYWLAWGTK